jgi:hypothetical protein
MARFPPLVLCTLVEPARFARVLLISVIPALVPHRQSVEDVAVELPLRHELIHQCHKALVMRWFEQVDHLVDDNIFKTLVALSGHL